MLKIFKKLSVGILLLSMLAPLYACSCNNNSNSKLDEGVNNETALERDLKLFSSKQNYRSRKELSDWILQTDFTESHNSDLKALKSKTFKADNKKSDNGISTLATKNVYSRSKEVEYIPYADIGIVEDTAEYLLKNKGLSGAHYDAAVSSLKTHGGENGLISYNNLSEFKNAGIANKFALGFMQNAFDSSELLPAWNATPPNDANESGKWYQQRLDKWKAGGINPATDLTITFGPFSNAFWHTAYLNNYNEIDLANTFKEIAKKYETKSFDFYFAAPYNANNSIYSYSVKLLAGALKILIEGDSSYQVRISMITGNDGFNIPGNDNDYDGTKNLIGDEMYPLYEFTKFLGANFVLNLVTGYLNVENVDTDNEGISDLLINQTVKNTVATWNKMLKKFSTISYSEAELKQRIALTPWIGRRAEQAKYKFTAKDALNIRRYAVQNNLNSISIFYISRDFPSYFEGGNTSSSGDQNPIDQNLRSGIGYQKFTYSKIFNGTLTTVPEVKVNKNDILNLPGALDWDNLIINNKDLDQFNNDSNSGFIGVTTNEIEDANKEKASKNKHLEWKVVNPSRTKTITDKTVANDQTYFAPYLDAGLWEGNDVNGALEQMPNLKNLTLAFVQQVNAHNDSLEFSIAGMSKGTPDYKWELENKLKAKILQPLKAKDYFKNLKVSYGGLNTGDNGKNPWEVAKNLYSDPNQAANALKTAMKQFNRELADLVNETKIPKKLDFDIEGNAQNKIDDIRILAKALVSLKQEDRAWEFSVTLPVLPSGLTPHAKKAYQVFIEEWNNANLEIDSLPILNIMAMDYGTQIYNHAIRNGKTNFNLAQMATDNTKINLHDLINSVYQRSIANNKLYKLLAVTPMIGINDQPEGIFSLEDAKELYNWAQQINLAYLAIWSFNDDDGRDSGGKARPKTLVSHGLNYLRKWDFMKAFLGEWDNKIKKPKTSI